MICFYDRLIDTVYAALSELALRSLTMNQSTPFSACLRSRFRHGKCLSEALISGNRDCAPRVCGSLSGTPLGVYTQAS